MGLFYVFRMREIEVLEATSIPVVFQASNTLGSLAIHVVLTLSNWLSE